jgi:hypothetical protein
MVYRRGMISFTKEHLEQILNENFHVYTNVAKYLRWSLYFNLIKRYVAKLLGFNLKKGETLRPAEERYLSKTICAIISGFHFDIPDVVDEMSNALKDSTKQNTKSIFEQFKVFTEIPEGEDEDQVEGKDVQIEVEEYFEDEENEEASQNVVVKQDRIYRSIIQPLLKHLKDSSTRSKTTNEFSIRSYVAVAVVKLLRKTRNETFIIGVK